MAYNREKNIGKVYGELTVLEFVSSRPGSATYKCECSCGTVKNFFIGNLRQGKTTSCGCLARELTSKRSKTHGERFSRMYRTWTNIKSRCYNRDVSSYKHYGAKGITMCSKWVNSYEAFRDWSLANGYRDDLSIDRIENSKGYTPDNCRWADATEQSRNRDYAWHITIDGVTKHAKDWCREYNVNYKTACTRKYRGWDHGEAVTTNSAK